MKRQRNISIFLLMVILLTTLSPNVYAKDNLTYSDWAEKEVLEAKEFGVIPENILDMTRSINREELTKSMLYFYLLYEDKLPEIGISFIDTNDIEIASAVSLGLVKGTHKNAFSPQKEVRREDAFVLINNLMDKLDVDIPTTEEVLIFEDESQISDYAFNAIQKLYKLGIVEGVGGNQIKPKDDINMEEVLALLVRVGDLIVENDIRQLKK